MVFIGLLLIASSPAYSIANKIVILSDCLSIAYGFAPESSWVQKLDQRLKVMHYPYEVVNMSNGGDTTQQGLEKISEILKVNPTLTILALGGNDGLRGLDPVFIENNLSQIIQKIQENGSKILLVRLLSLPTNYGSVYSKRFASIFDRLSEKHHLKIVSVKSIEESNKKQQDNVHLSENAQMDILNTLWPYIIESLKKEES